MPNCKLEQRACRRCSDLSKHCDRARPDCQNCIAAGYTCEYRVSVADMHFQPGHRSDQLTSIAHPQSMKSIAETPSKILQTSQKINEVTDLICGNCGEAYTHRKYHWKYCCNKNPRKAENIERRRVSSQKHPGPRKHPYKPRPLLGPRQTMNATNRQDADTEVVHDEIEEDLQSAELSSNSSPDRDTDPDYVYGDSGEVQSSDVEDEELSASESSISDKATKKSISVCPDCNEFIDVALKYHRRVQCKKNPMSRLNKLQDDVTRYKKEAQRVKAELKKLQSSKCTTQLQHPARSNLQLVENNEVKDTLESWGHDYVWSILSSLAQESAYSLITATVVTMFPGKKEIDIVSSLLGLIEADMSRKTTVVDILAHYVDSSSGNKFSKIWKYLSIKLTSGKEAKAWNDIVDRFTHIISN